MCVLKLDAYVQRRRNTCACKRRIWRLKDTGVQQRYKAQFDITAANREVDDVEGLWCGLKEGLLKAVDDVCGSAKGARRYKETWWWNGEVAEVVQTKRKTFLAWKKTDDLSDKEAYLYAKRNAKQVIAKAQECRRKQFAENLHNADGKGELYRVVRQLKRKNADVYWKWLCEEQGE